MILNGLFYIVYIFDTFYACYIVRCFNLVLMSTFELFSAFTLNLLYMYNTIYRKFNSAMQFLRRKVLIIICLSLCLSRLYPPIYN